MNKKTMKTNLLRFMLLCTFIIGIVNCTTVAHAAKKPLIGVSLHSENKQRLYVGMQWSPCVCYEYGKKDSEKNIWMYESAGTLKNVKFTSSNKKIATVSKDGIVKAKKAGTTVIKIESTELNAKIKVKVLKIKKVNKKNLVKEVKRTSQEFDWPLIYTYDKNSADVKKGYVKANKKYDMSLYSIRKYKQPDGKYRYVFAYSILNTNGKEISGVKKIEVSVEEVMKFWGLCSNFDSTKTVASAVKEGHCSLGWQYPPYDFDKGLKKLKTYARDKDMYKSENAYLSATGKYGWRNMCWN